MLTFLKRIQNTKLYKNTLVGIQVVLCGLTVGWRNMTRLVVCIRSPNEAIKGLSNSNKKQDQFNVLNLLYCDRSCQEEIT
jgi:hypothetical protein